LKLWKEVEGGVDFFDVRPFFIKLLLVFDF